MIHFTKQRLIGQTIRVIQQCQEKTFNFKTVISIRQVFDRLLNGKQLSDDYLWKLSKEFDAIEKDTTTPISEIESPDLSIPSISYPLQTLSLFSISF